MRALTVILCLCLLPITAEAQKPQRGDNRAIDLRTNQTFRDSPSDRTQQRDNRFDNRRDNRNFREEEPAEPSVDVERILPYLAYTLGELHYLDYACSGNDAQVWRDQMIALLAMEAAESRNRRDRLIENFNEGYRVQQRFRAVCGPQVEAERRALAHRGRDLSELMRSAYFD
ncbi:TIGR02301 family protein [Maricaulis sp.]|uniref:TIGR02301 family protein n=1 Tax=unclassified Maricaulis TaxID=2632371 RepID=UPI001B197193|nr:TIGR02301 family protein [Maricaulis sp.]MBO6797235.1 TIGR02301 family protein [Maricaulis sp.]